MDCRQPGLSVHGILQARIREWVAISFSRGSSQPRDWTCVFGIGRWILYHGTTWKAQQHNSQAVGERLFIINTWRLGEVSLVCGWCWWLQWFFLKIFLSSLWCVVPTSKTKRAIKQNKGKIFIELDLDCHLVDVWICNLVLTKQIAKQMYTFIFKVCENYWKRFDYSLKALMLQKKSLRPRGWNDLVTFSFGQSDGQFWYINYALPAQ